jgi:hypothetical protein
VIQISNENTGYVVSNESISFRISNFKYPLTRAEMKILAGY